MFGIVPRPLWEKASPSDDANRIRMAARCLLLDLGDRKVLVDTGMGDKWSEKERGIYRVEHPDGGIRDALAGLGVAVGDITDIVMTHLHFDHAGGLTERTEDGGLRPTFPQAVVHVQRENWAWAHRPTLRDAGSYREENFRPLVGPEGPQVQLVDGAARLLGDRVEVLPMAGHTPGMQVVRFDSGGTRFAFLADLIPTRAHVPLAWVMGYDLDPVRTTREKREILEMAIREDWVLVLQHEPDLPFVRVERTGQDRYRVAEAAATASELSPA